MHIEAGQSFLSPRYIPIDSFLVLLSGGGMGSCNIRHEYQQITATHTTPCTTSHYQLTTVKPMGYTFVDEDVLNQSLGYEVSRYG